MSVISGINGTLHVGASELLEVQEWKLTRKVAGQQYASNNTNGFKKAVAGVKSGTVEFKGIYDPSIPPDDFFDVGDLVTVKGYVDATNFYTIPMLVEELDLTVDFDEGKIVEWSAKGPTNGAWTEPT